MKKINIAIDGYSSCGKSTLAKSIAKRFGYIYIDTGAMYRAVTLYFLRKGIIHDGIIDRSLLEAQLAEIHIDFKFNVDRNAVETYLNGENVEVEIREMEVSSNVSKISQIKAVREKLVKIQRAVGQKKGVVMDGRDIGTVVFPNAELKIFLIAEDDIRAERRYKELKEKGIEVSKAEIVENLHERDFEDLNRVESPLKKAADAIVIDNSHMSITALENKAFALVENAITVAQQ